MKILKEKLHVVFGELQIGETFVYDNKPFIKCAQSARSKLPEPPHNAVALESGTLYVFLSDKQIVKVELGVTGLEDEKD